MSLSDPIGDMIARIKNAQVRNHKVITLPSSKFKVKLAEVLKEKGYPIARRTVAKYREQLHIPVARLRKEI